MITQGKGMRTVMVDARTGKVKREIGLRGAKCVGVSGDGSKIAMGHDGMVVVLGKKWMQVTEMEGWCRDVGFGRDGQRAMALARREVIEIAIMDGE